MGMPRQMADGSHPIVSTVNEVMRVSFLSKMPMTFASAPGHVEDSSHGAPSTKPWLYGEAEARNPSGTTVVRALFWKKEVPDKNTDWYLVCIYLAKTEAQSRPLCEEFRAGLVLRNRYRPSVEAKLVIDSLLWIAAIALGLALLRFRPDWRPTIEVFTCVAAIAAARGAGSFAVGGAGSFESKNLSAGILTATLVLASLAYAAANVAQWFAPSPARAIGRHIAESFLVAVIAAAILFILYVYAAEGSEHSNQIRGAIVCAALTWELWMSGGTFTNKSSALMPRWARVTVLIGYLVLVATCTFFFVTTTVTYSEQVWLGFETEPLVAAGIVVLGVPYLMLRHLDRLRRAADAYALT